MQLCLFYWGVMPDGKELSIGRICISMSIGNTPNDILEQIIQVYFLHVKGK